MAVSPSDNTSTKTISPLKYGKDIPKWWQKKYMSWDNHRIVKGYKKDNIMTKVKIYRNSGRSNIWHGTFIAL